MSAVEFGAWWMGVNLFVLGLFWLNAKSNRRLR